MLLASFAFRASALQAMAFFIGLLLSLHFIFGHSPLRASLGLGFLMLLQARMLQYFCTQPQAFFLVSTMRNGKKLY